MYTIEIPCIQDAYGGGGGGGGGGWRESSTVIARAKFSASPTKRV